MGFPSIFNSCFRSKKWSHSEASNFPAEPKINSTPAPAASPSLKNKPMSSKVPTQVPSTKTPSPTYTSPARAPATVSSTANTDSCNYNNTAAANAMLFNSYAPAPSSSVYSGGGGYSGGYSGGDCGGGSYSTGISSAGAGACAPPPSFSC